MTLQDGWRKPVMHQLGAPARVSSGGASQFTLIGSHSHHQHTVCPPPPIPLRQDFPNFHQFLPLPPHPQPASTALVTRDTGLAASCPGMEGAQKSPAIRVTMEGEPRNSGVDGSCMGHATLKQPRRRRIGTGLAPDLHPQKKRRRPSFIHRMSQLHQRPGKAAGSQSLFRLAVPPQFLLLTNIGRGSGWVGWMGRLQER